MTMLRRTIATSALACTAALAVGAGLSPALAHDGVDHAAPEVSPTLLATVRSATAAFHDPDAAIAAGFVPTSTCFPEMGQHWVNPANVADGVHDLRKPDILLFEPTSHGPKLVGVEWFQVDADQDLGTDEDRPGLRGVPFDGPMLPHEEGGPVHYDLHLYVWKHNPHGTAAMHNARVAC